MSTDNRAPLTVLVTEPVMHRFADRLTEGGTSSHRWVFTERETAEAFEVAAHADVIVSSAPSRELLAATTGLRLVHAHGAGYDKLPFDALPPGVQVANTFHHGRSIAEYVLTVTGTLLRQLIPADQRMRSGVWTNAMIDRDRAFAPTIASRTFGLVGCGEIGSQIAALATAYGAQVQAVKRRPEATLSNGVQLQWVGDQTQLRELAEACGVLVVTVPLDDSTTGLIDSDVLKALGPDGILINVSRGAVVDEDALHRALTDGVIGGAGLDVWWRNPSAKGVDSPAHRDFTGFPNVVLTAHESGHTEETFAGRADDIVANVAALEAGAPLRNLVTWRPE